MTDTYRFYPRHPRGWRRVKGLFFFPVIKVSIHATLAGGDGPRPTTLFRFLMFLSTPPSRVATRRFAPAV